MGVASAQFYLLPLQIFSCGFLHFTAADTRRRSDSFPIFRNKKKTKSIKWHGDRKIPIRFRSVTEGTPATGWRQHKDAPNTQKKKIQQNSHLVARQSNNNNSPPEGSQAPNALRLQLEEPAFPENHPPAQCGARQFRAFFFSRLWDRPGLPFSGLSVTYRAPRMALSARIAGSTSAAAENLTLQTHQVPPVGLGVVASCPIDNLTVDILHSRHSMTLNEQ